MAHEYSKVLIAGAGTFGFGTAMVLTRQADIATSIWNIYTQDVEDWNTLGYCGRYPWMQQYGKPDLLTIVASDRIDASGYDFILLASSMEGLEPTLQLIDNLDEKRTVLVTMQKGLNDQLETPYRVVRRHFPQIPVIQYTGAGFGENMASGDWTRMIIASGKGHWKSAKAFQRLFLGTNIWARLSLDPTGMCHGGVLRTITSPQTAIVQHYLANQPGSWAAAMAGINDEYWCLLKQLGTRVRTRQDGSDEKKTLLADLWLCQQTGNVSRNTAFGKYLAGGMPVEQALSAAQQNGVVESYSNLRVVHDLLTGQGIDLAKEQSCFPYLYYLYHLVYREMPISECIDGIQHRQANGF